jgi:hypothetical protein
MKCLVTKKKFACFFAKRCFEAVLSFSCVQQESEYNKVIFIERKLTNSTFWGTPIYSERINYGA